jgi:hypothetical protein
MERRLDSDDLLEDALTVSAALDHGRDTVQVTFDPAQTTHQVHLVFKQITDHP